jgi:hypothetical protein
VALRPCEDGIASPRSRCGRQSIYFRTGRTVIMARFAGRSGSLLRSAPAIDDQLAPGNEG